MRLCLTHFLNKLSKTIQEVVKVLYHLSFFELNSKLNYVLNQYNPLHIKAVCLLHQIHQTILVSKK